MLNKENPLWLPKGSVRAIIATGVVCGYAYLCVKTGNIEALGLITVMVMKDYFSSKDK